MFNYSKTQSHLFACNHQFSGLPSVVSSDDEDIVLVKNASLCTTNINKLFVIPKKFERNMIFFYLTDIVKSVLVFKMKNYSPKLRRTWLLMVQLMIYSLQ